MLGNEGMIQRGRGLVDLIAGKTPTFNDWTNYPTDAADITDGDITTFCTTGNKVTTGAWGYAYFEWDLGAFYNVLLSGVGAIAADAGTPSAYLYFWNGAAWISCDNRAFGDVVCASRLYLAAASKIRIGITSSSAATITPNIREFHAWRLQ